MESKMNEKTNEKDITDLAVRYLTEVHEALKAALRQEMIDEENIPSALHCCEWSAFYASKLVENQKVLEDSRLRMFAVRDAMMWLKIMFGQKEELLANTGMSVPTLSDVEFAHFRASRPRGD